MTRWLFLSNHLHVLALIDERPDVRIRELADGVQITERAAHRIVSELIVQGYISRSRIGTRNRYEIHREAPLRHPLRDGQTVGEILDLLSRGRAGVHSAQRDGQFAAVFEASPAALVIINANGEIIYANRAFCSILDATPQDLAGDVFRFIHPEDVETGQQLFAELMDDELTEYVREARFLRMDGRLTWARVHVTKTTDPASGRPLAISHAVQIDDRKRQDQDLAEAEERFRSAFDNAPIGMALVSPDGRWLKVNHSVSEITGYSETALLRRTFQDITHPDDLSADLAYLDEMLAGKRRTYQMEKRYVHAHGHIVWINLSVSLVRDSAGKPLYFISQIEDITERKRREQALRDQADRAVGRRPPRTRGPAPQRAPQP